MNEQPAAVQPQSAREQQPTDYSFEVRRWYLALSSAWRNVSGDLDGESFFQQPFEVWIVPKLDPAPAFSVAVGRRWRWVAVEAAFTQATHGDKWAGFIGESVGRQLSFDGRFFPLHEKPLQPFLVGGFSIRWLRVEDGYYSVDGFDRSRVESASAQYQGLGLNLGAGAEYYMLRSLGVSVSAVLQPSFYGQVKGEGGFEDGHNIENLTETSFDLRGRVTLYF